MTPLNKVIPSGEQSLKRNEPLEHEAEPEKKRTAEHESIKQSGEREKNGSLNVKSIKQSLKETGC